MDFDFLDYTVKCNVKNPADFTDRCAVLRLFLEAHNSHVNLTRLTSPEDFYLKHAADSLSIACIFPEITTDKFSIADIGCGAGFPSLILAMAYPQLDITAIDSIGKKTTFVQLAAERLGLSNITVVHRRSAELNCLKEFQNKFDIVTARAVAPSPKIFREANRFIRKGGRYIFYKTPQQAAEEEKELARIKEMVWQNSPVFSLPGDAGERVFTCGRYLKK
jgi:16S rRNA (guanine527-N7)-methyltransferase